MTLIFLSVLPLMAAAIWVYSGILRDQRARKAEQEKAERELLGWCQAMRELTDWKIARMKEDAEFFYKTTLSTK